MSYRVGTDNYNLPLTEGTDKRDWSDTNQAFLAIDTAIKGAVDASASAGAAAAAAQTSADNAATTAAHAQTDATTAQTLATSASELATLAKTTADSAKTLSEAATESSGSATLRNVTGLNNPEVQVRREGRVCTIHYAAQLSVYSFSGMVVPLVVSDDLKPQFNVTGGMILASDQNANGRAILLPTGELKLGLPSTIQGTLPTYLDVTLTYVL